MTKGTRKGSARLYIGPSAYYKVFTIGLYHGCLCLLHAGLAYSAGVYHGCLRLLQGVYRMVLNPYFNRLQLHTYVCICICIQLMLVFMPHAYMAYISL
jgi:hypothetical protein